jgi:secreted trypsin-like serine protease
MTSRKILGKTNIKTEVSLDLMEVNLKIHTLSRCKNAYDDLDIFFNENYMICAGSSKKGVCKGDSGK